MTIYFKKVIQKMLEIIEKIKREKGVDNYYGKPILQEQEGSDLISQVCDPDKPLMVARMGNVELLCISNYLKRKENNKVKYKESVKFTMLNNAGFFPSTDKMLDRFSEEFIEHLANVDVMGVWFNKNEDCICHKYCESAKLVRLRCIEPYYHIRPWSAKLKGKKVLVIHPFQETIENQYKNKRENIFDNQEILPLFHLETIKAVQSNANSKTIFRNWFQAYQYMCDEILKKDFEIAIIGAGAYGLPLASYIKKLGKKAIHIGGATQILFGIKGKRWDNHEVISKLYNQYWVRPAESETPQGYQAVEDGCYW